MSDGADFLEALNAIEKEKGIDKEVIFEAIETSLVTACRRNFSPEQMVKVEIDRETGKVEVYSQRLVVEEVVDPMTEISLEDARKESLQFDLEDYVDELVTPKDFDRIAAQTAKQVVVQKFREAEREFLYEEFIDKERELVTGIIQRAERNNIIISFGKADAVLGPNERIPGELYHQHGRIKVYVTEVRQTTKGPQIMVSRSHPNLVKRLFEEVVPEVYDGTVEIKSIAREAGSRTKMAVYSSNEAVDPVGACVGQNGMRVNEVVEEINGEKIDIVHWSEDPREFIAQALKPSEVLAVALNEPDKSAKIVVPDHQLSLSIGKAGQNARLAARLTGWRIDIKSESQAEEMGYLTEEELQEGVFGNEVDVTESEEADEEVELDDVAETDEVEELEETPEMEEETEEVEEDSEEVEEDFDEELLDEEVLDEEDIDEISAAIDALAEAQAEED